MTRDEKISVGSFAAIGMMFVEAVRLNSALALDDLIKTVRHRFVEHSEFEQRLTITERIVTAWERET